MTTSDSASDAGGAAGAVTVRAAVDERERSAVIRGEFRSDTVYDVTVSESGFNLSPRPLDPPVHKVFPDDEPAGEEPGNSHRIVAVAGERVCGYVDTEYEPWNRRLVVADIEVAGPWQGRGIGRALMSHAVERARACGAGHVWLEVTNINAPAIRAYRRMGFAFCGLDTTLYRGTASEGETALFMSLPLD
ncbi:GNAT family N-acetyltransferase [Streptomyces californicus]|uniref:GNAT family N-acetyltransferase n=1 Tax=Streptomyces californicus TaxID=67351 RepID=UPI00365FD269